MSGSTLDRRPRGLGVSVPLAIAWVMMSLAWGCSDPAEAPVREPRPVAQAQPSANQETEDEPRQELPPEVRQTFDSSWFRLVEETLDLHLWERADFQETWGERLRAQQHREGNLPALLWDFTWSPLAEAALGEAAGLASHGIDPARLPEGLVETLGALRAELAGLPPLTGHPAEDAPRIVTAVHAEQALSHLVVRLADLLGAKSARPPRSSRGLQEAVFQALPTWRRVPAMIRTLAPPMVAYERLRAALHRYEEIESAGGFVELNMRVLRRSRPRRTHHTLGALRQRLAQEDPAVRPDGNSWDDDLTAALRRARAAHQLRTTGPRSKLLDDKLLKALSVPIGERVKTIKHNLARWRGSEARHHDYAIHVNLPDYHAELRNGDDLIRRFKIVIGNAKRSRETRTMRNATPLLSSAIRTVIFNPYWNVPERILKEELVPEAHRAIKRAAEERGDDLATIDENELLSTDSVVEYFNTHGYEVLNRTASGRLWIRQLPGPSNALGKVKFMFPNRHSVFMHDTPAKGKFRFPRRAFSHGCMRVHEPIELARILLERDGNWSKYRARKGLRTEKQLVIPLDSPVPLVVDYITNHVDDEGRVHWLHDIYKYDES